MTDTARFPSLAERPESVGEIVADAFVHAIAIMAGMVAISVLFTAVVRRGDLGEALAVGVYAAGFFTLFGCSAAYNLAPPSPVKGLLRRLDHSSIYLMIAGTYTPLLTQFRDPVWAWSLAAVVWIGALAGIAVKIGLPRRYDRISIAAYVALGWVVVFAIGPLVEALPVPSLILIAVGGLFYTSGIVFHLWRSLKFQNAIWHLFVTVAAGCQFAGIAVSLGRSIA
ncbi:hemolysin III family protein [Siculibacillus lacustris]|uniref:Hemolysin III family protein n=1 Tax=Siculibacillus lacustris TaxID=1549641 RepID=A0A4Q9VYQ9_9HYPH|nr:hemolysin III family protein [Siculibacillus lacustris]TBW40641.1 hemolysin III family protein [Siculibacillus lacustris]